MAYSKKKAEGIAKMMAGILRNTMNNVENENGQKMADALNNMLQQDQSKYPWKHYWKYSEKLMLDDILIVLFLYR